MKLCAAVVFAAAFLGPYGASGAFIRGSPVRVAPHNGTSVRALFEDFSRLSCNEGVNQASCQPWSKKFGSASVFRDRIVVDCGECVRMDHSGPELELLDGIDIRGRLLFIHGYELTLTTTLVVVQGELIMHSRKPIDGNPAVRFVMIGDTDQFFAPIGENSGKCGGPDCNAGKKAIIVAGGRIKVNALPDAQMPTWMKLHDVKRIYDKQSRSLLDRVYVPPFLGDGCADDGVYFSVKYSEGCVESDEFSGMLGTKWHCTDSSLQISDRNSTLHGVRLDMKNFRHCLSSTHTYLLTARVRIGQNAEKTNSPSECSLNGKNCIVIKQEYMNQALSRSASTVWEETQALSSKHGELLTIATEVTFSEEELDGTNVYQVIKLIGLGAEIDFEVEEFNFYLPSQSSFPPPSDECEYLAPVHSDAEGAGLSPYPMYTTHTWIYATIEVDPSFPTNHYFRVRGRKHRNIERAGLAWNIFSPDCLVEGAYLRFHADVRLPIGSEVGSVLLQPLLRVEYDSGDASAMLLAECPVVTASKWTECEGVFIVPASFADGSVRAVQVILAATSGVDYDVDNISITQKGSNPNTLVVDKAVLGKWAPGAEVLITSHTTNWDGHQVRKITEVFPYYDSRFVCLKLDSPIVRPTTIRESPDFAVEVALLSRNIMFEGGPDSNPRHGGHFWVFHTPAIDQIQVIEGLEVRNFGQQGILGRYPLHFHLAGDHSGSVIAKCTVRDSNQRAIVVHGTHNLVVESNVVFNTRGHAILVEDGIETGNLFKGNLVAATGSVVVVIPDSGMNGKETDSFPASYWISNPDNAFIGNVAAGSESSGFWFELRVRGPNAHLFHGDIRTVSLGTFEGNIVHSSGDRGLRTYPTGYIPDETANFLGLVSYKNSKKGLFFHQTENIAITDSLFADNAMAIDIDRSDRITLTNTTIIGQTRLYRDVVDFQGARSVCRHQDELIGMEIHTFTRKSENYGAAVANVRFAGFDENACTKVAHVKLDQAKRHGTFDWFATFEQVETSDQSALFNFCPASAVGVSDVYLIDRDGKFGDSKDSPGTIISNSDNMKVFLESSQCIIDGDRCSAYCKACFRTVQFETDPSGTDNYVLRVCAKSGSPCTDINGYTDPNEKPKNAINPRIFNAHLPHGLYDAVFLTQPGGVEEWPTFVRETYKEKLCGGSFDDGAIELKKPVLPKEQCNNLIRNGSAESLQEWLQIFGGLALARGSGIGGSNALSDAGGKNSAQDSIVQFIDIRCIDMMKGRSYEVIAWVKLVDKAGNAKGCHLDSRGCPEVRIVTSGTTRASVATFVPQLIEGDFQLLHGTLNLDQELADSPSVEFVIQKNRGDYSMQVDNISMNLMPDYKSDAGLCSENLVENGDFESGDAAFWSRTEAYMRMHRAGQGFRLALAKGGDAFVTLKAGCFKAGERYEVSIKYKINNTGIGIVCDPSTSSGFYKCPSAKLMAFEGGTFLSGLRVVKALKPDENSSWALLYGFFIGTDDHSRADQIMLGLDEMDKRHVYVIDSVSVKHVQSTCDSNFVQNGDMEMGVVSYWVPGGSGSIELKTPGYGGSSKALLASGRDFSSFGPKLYTDDFLDARCATPGARWEIRAQMKLVNAATGKEISCRIGSSSSDVDACPAVKVEIRDGNGVRVMNMYPRNYVKSSWDPNDWNEFKATISLPSSTVWDGTVSRVVIQIRNFPAEMDVVVDNFVIRTL